MVLIPETEMSQIPWEEWVKNKCPHEQHWKEFNRCLLENTMDFQELVKNQSHPAEHGIKLNRNNGVVHILNLNKSSIRQIKDIDEDAFYTLGLNPNLKFTLELKDPTFLFLSPNPLTFPATRLFIQKNSSHRIIYLKVEKIYRCLLYKFVKLRS